MSTDVPKPKPPAKPAARQQTQARCTKRSFTLGAARRLRHLKDQAGERPVWVIPCYRGCHPGFHLSWDRPSPKNRNMYNKPWRESSISAERRAYKRARSRKNQEAYRVMSVGTWLDDGGALHPSEWET